MTPIIQTMKVQNGYSQQYKPVNTGFGASDNQQTQPAFSAGNSSQTNNTQSDKILQNNALINAATTPPEKPASFAASAVMSLLGIFGVNRLLNQPLINQDYNSTLFKKIENFGDKVGNKAVMKKAGNVLSAVKTKASAIVDKSEILRTFFRKPSLGGSGAMTQAMSTRQHLASKALETITLYNEQHPNAVFQKLINRIGKDKDTYKYYDEIFKAISKSGADVKKVLTEKSPWTLGLLNNKTSLQEILNKKILVDNYNTGKTLGQKLSGYFMRGTESLTNGFFGGKGALLLQSLFVAQSLNEASKAEKGEKFSTFMASLIELMAYVATAGIQQRIVNGIAGLKYMGFTPMQVKRYKSAIKLANKAAQKKDFASHAYYSLKATNLRKIAADGLKWYQMPFKWLGNIASLGRVRETIKPLKSGAVSQALSKLWYGLKYGTGWIARVGFIMAVLMPFFAGTAKKISYVIFGKPTKTIEREKQKELEEQRKMEEEAKKAEAQQVQEPEKSAVQKPDAVQPQQQAQPIQPQQQRPSGSLLDKMNNMYHTAPAQQPVVQQQAVPSQPLAYQPVYPQQYTQQPMYPQYVQPQYYPQQPMYPQQQPYQQQMFQQYPQPQAQNAIASAPITKTQQAPDAGIKRSYVPNPILGVEKTPVVTGTRNAQIDHVMRQADIAEAQAAKYL